MSDQYDQSQTAEKDTDDHADVGVDPMHPHPQDGRSRAGETDDDSPVDRYRDSPGLAIDDETGEIPEPNEPA